MTLSADTWQARAALCELLALSFRYPDDSTLADAVASGEWDDAAEEIAGVLDLSWDGGAAPGAAEAAELSDPVELHRALRVEATKLFIGAPKALVSPFEGIWRAKAAGVKPLLFVNPHTADVERFFKACGLGHAEGVNEPLDAVWTELEFLEYLALRAVEDMAGAGDGDGAVTEAEADDAESVASADLPGGSPEAAWDMFMDEHAEVWMPRFAAAVEETSRVPFYRRAAKLLAAFMESVG